MSFIEKSVIVDKTSHMRSAACNAICSTLPALLLKKILLKKNWENRTSAEFVFEAYIISPLEMSHIIEAIRDKRYLDAEALLTGVSNPIEVDPGLPDSSSG